MAISPEAQAQVQLWRQKAREGSLTQDEMRQAIAILRQDRVAASGTSDKAKTTRATSRAKKNINSDDLLGELDGL